VLAGVAAGAASALYLASFTYHPPLLLLLHGTIHAAIFASGLIAGYFAKALTAKKAGLYVAGALPVHIAIHFTVIGDLAQLMIGVSHLLNFASLP
jgi:hypothetical protein